MIRASWIMEVYLNESWVDITSDVIGWSSNGEWGLGSGDHTEFVADTGELTFELRNYSPVGKYSPNHANCVSGWKKGVPIRQSFYYDGELYKRFRYYVQEIENAGGKDERKRITALDWMEFASRNPIQNPGILENKRGDEVLNSTLALMPIQPQATDFDAGVNTFPTAFDTVTSKTKAINEFSKVASSELGYVYLKKDATHGETLRFENAYARNGLIKPTSFYVPETDAGFLLLEESGEYLLLEEGGTGRLSLAGQTLETIHLDNDPSVLAYEFEDGENVINRFTVYAIPRRIDTSPQILFKLDTPIQIASGQTITIKGTYANPAGGLPVNANPDDMVTPVATTDYLAFVNSDSTGTELTGSLVVTPSYGTNGFTHTVYNGSVNGGWVTVFNCRGYGVYTYNSIEHQENDIDSQDEYGIISGSLTQKYKNNLAYGAIYADWVVDEEKEGRTVLKKIYLNANKDILLMMAFLNLDIGDLVRVAEDKSQTDSYYFIQGISYQTRPGGILMFQWILKPVLLLSLGLSQLGVEFGVGDGVNFGSVPTINNQNKKTVSFLINPTSDPAASKVILLYDGLTIGISTSNKSIFWYQNQTGTTGIWKTPDNSISLNALNHVVLSRDTSVSGTQDPLIYINGALQALTETSSPSGTPTHDGNVLLIGNAYSFAFPYYGQIKDVRFYNRILSASEITTLYNGGTPDMDLVTDGLQFQAFVVPTNRLSRYINQTLTPNMKLRDRIHGAIGTPVGTPIGRSW